MRVSYIHACDTGNAWNLAIERKNNLYLVAAKELLPDAVTFYYDFGGFGRAASPSGWGQVRTLETLETSVNRILCGLLVVLRLYVTCLYARAGDVLLYSPTGLHSKKTQIYSQSAFTPSRKLAISVRHCELVHSPLPLPLSLTCLLLHTPLATADVESFSADLPTCHAS